MQRTSLRPALAVVRCAVAQAERTLDNIELVDATCETVKPYRTQSLYATAGSHYSLPGSSPAASLCPCLSCCVGTHSMCTPLCQDAEHAKCLSVRRVPIDYCQMSPVLPAWKHKSGTSLSFRVKEKPLSTSATPRATELTEQAARQTSGSTGKL